MTTLVQFKALVAAIPVENDENDVRIMVGSNNTNADVVWVLQNGKIMIADADDYAAYTAE